MSCGTILTPEQRKRIDALMSGFDYAQKTDRSAKTAIKKSGLTEEVFRKTLKELKDINLDAYRTVSSNLDMEDIGEMF